MYTKFCMCVCVWNRACGCVVCFYCMHSLNPLLKLGTVQCRQITVLPLSPLTPSLLSATFFLLSSLHLFSFFWLPTSSPLLMLPPLFFCAPHPPPSAFDDLSQAHGEYSKGGYGGSAQSQAKSAGSGPGKGKNTCAHSNYTRESVAIFL